MSEFETKPGSTAEQLEELESARGLIETGGVRSMAVVCVMRSGELSRISSCAPEDWLGLRGGLMTAALGLDGEEEQEETEAAQVVPIGGDVDVRGSAESVERYEDEGSSPPRVTLPSGSRRHAAAIDMSAAESVSAETTAE